MPLVWRQFIEGMICRGLRDLQEIYTTVKGSNITGEQWATGVIIKLVETTQGTRTMVLLLCPGPRQDLRNPSNTAKGEAANGYQRTPRHRPEGSIGRGSNLVGLNLEDLEHTSGKRQEYWLVAIQAAWEAGQLQRLSQTNIHRRKAAIRGRIHTQKLQPCSIREEGFE